MRLDGLSSVQIPFQPVGIDDIGDLIAQFGVGAAKIAEQELGQIFERVSLRYRIFII